MIEFFTPLKPWIFFGPELSLAGLILLLLSFELFSKTYRPKLIYLAVTGCFFIFLTFIPLWPISGSALYDMFQVNALSTFMKGILLGAAFLTLLTAREYTETLGHRSNDFLILILVSTLGAFFLASTNDLISLFITIEWMTISLYILTAYLRTDEYSLEAGTKYLIMGAFSSALFLYGISFIYGMVGGIGFDQIRQALPAVQENPLFLAGFFLILSGIGFKISAFPFQLWVPDVYQGAPTPVTAFLSVASKTAGFTALIKILFVMTGQNTLNWPIVIGVLSATTLLYGNLGALGQTNMKRLLAYSSIGHAGYLLMAAATGTLLGIEALLFYLVAYAISNLTVFLIVTITNRDLGNGEIASYRGLAKKNPFLAACFFIALLSLGGIPPLAGFFGKFLVLQAAVLRGYLWLALLGAVNVIISLYYYLSVVKEMYFKTAAADEKIKLRTSTQILLLLLVIAIIGIGIFQAPLLNLVKIAALSFLPVGQV
ncbi:MAG: NADH-quinone oxidoreductase subunit N [Candidatus Omnitrophica bacterium]|nr:NADH-quinone oxidoreductase subunit N [Candidatus Omnitrophota bacterium]